MPPLRITDPLVERIPSGVTITCPPCISGENLPKLSWEVSVAVKADITSAKACDETLACYAPLGKRKQH